MKIDNNFTVEKDSLSFILHYEKPTGKFNKDGKEIISRDKTYHISLKDALKSYVNKAVDVSHSATTVLSQLEEIEDTINNLNTLKIN